MILAKDGAQADVAMSQMLSALAPCVRCRRTSAAAVRVVLEDAALR
jgi:aromatic-amino-acid transaminase